MARPKGRESAEGVRKGHVPYWPPYYSDTRDRDVCLIQPTGHDEYRLVWRDGRESGVFTTYLEWKALVLAMSSKSVDCFVGELEQDGHGFPWLWDAVHDQHAKVKCAKNGGVTGITVRCGRRSITIGSLSHWKSHWYDVDPLQLLETIGDIGEYTGVGASISPGALGTSVLYRMWKSEGPTFPKVSRPPKALLEILQEFSIAGRVEDFTNKKRLRQAFELDLRSAYLSCCAQIPWGTQVNIDHMPDVEECNKRYATWFCQVDVSIVRKLAISPVPIRNKKSGHWTWAVNVGTHTTWMWREEVEKAIEAGCFVEVKHGWGWKHLSNRLMPWAAAMERYRSEFEALGRMDLADMVKSSTVSAIGWTGCYTTRYKLAMDYQKGDHPLIGKNGRISHWVLRGENVDSSPSPNHIHSYILMRCRVKVYARELEELYTGNNIQVVNFDAIYVERPSSLPIGRSMGQWKQKELHERNERGIFATGPRSLLTTEVVKLPGLPRNSVLRASYTSVTGAEVTPSTSAPGAENDAAPTADSPPS